MKTTTTTLSTLPITAASTPTATLTPTLNTFMKTLLIPSLLALVLWSCNSPLDTDTPRTITPLTPAPKVAPLSITPEFSNASGTFQFKGSPSILVDTTVSPMRFWMDFNMEKVPDTASSAIPPLLVEFRVNVDSFAGSGLNEELVGSQAKQFFVNHLAVIDSVACDLTTNTANLLVTEHVRVSGEKRKVTIYVYMITNKNFFDPRLRQDQVLGKIELEI